jgi:hypothetical protein
MAGQKIMLSHGVGNEKRYKQRLKLAIPRSLLRGHLIEGRVRETAGFSVEHSTFIPRQLAAGY